MQQDGQTLHKKGTNYMVKKSINGNQIKNYKYYKQEIRQKNKKIYIKNRFRLPNLFERDIMKTT